MKNFDIHRHRVTEMLAYLRTSADEVRAALSVRTLTSHGYIVTRDGHAMDARRLDDGTATATIATPTSATRWTQQDAEALAQAFEGEAGEWRAEYWRDAAARDLDLLEDMITSVEARAARIDAKGDA